MAGKIIWWVVTFGCGILFFCIGVHAQKLKKPMHFWSGSTVDGAKLTDVEQYNRENGVMWKWYSVWYFAAGIAEVWNTMVAFVILMLSCTVGMWILVSSYNRIYNRYKIQ